MIRVFRVHASVHMEARDNPVDVAFSFHFYVHSRDWTRVVRLVQQVPDNAYLLSPQLLKQYLLKVIFVATWLHAISFYMSSLAFYPVITVYSDVNRRGIFNLHFTMSLIQSLGQVRKKQ